LTGFGGVGKGNDNGKDVPGIANEKKGEGIFTLFPFYPLLESFSESTPKH
jgi:hypothetical protein